jgi:excisionase family DNA binding protein
VTTPPRHLKIGVVVVTETEGRRRAGGGGGVLMNRRDWEGKENGEKDRGQKKDRYGGTGNGGLKEITIEGDSFFERLMTVEEFADALGLAPQTIRNWVAMRKLPYLKIGGRTRFRRGSLRAWLAQQEKQPCQ